MADLAASSRRRVARRDDDTATLRRTKSAARTGSRSVRPVSPALFDGDVAAFDVADLR